MNRYAVVRTSDGLVVNVIEWDGENDWSPPVGHQAIQSDTADIGGTWNGSQFIPPSASQPDQWAANIESLRAYVTDAGLTSYLNNSSPTNAQTLAVVKGTATTMRTLLRVLYRIVS